jgi:hypothetical protein
MNLFYKEKLCEVLKNNNVDAILIAPGEELEFILGHTTHICERFQALFIKATGEYFYVCNKLTEDEITMHMDGNKVYGWYDKEGFTVKYFLGYRRHFSYSEIESIQGNLRDVKLRVRGCTVRVDEAAIGKLEFLAFAKKQYRIHSGGKAIPKAKPKGDIFNGHVDNPSEFIFAYLLVLLFMPGMLLISFFP